MNKSYVICQKKNKILNNEILFDLLEVYGGKVEDPKVQHGIYAGQACRGNAWLPIRKKARKHRQKQLVAETYLDSITGINIFVLELSRIKNGMSLTVLKNSMISL